MFLKNWTTCSKYVDHSQLNGEKNWSGFDFDNEKILI